MMDPELAAASVLLERPDISDAVGARALLDDLREPSSSADEETVLVKKLTFLARSETGTAELLALDAFCQCRSLRTAAAKLNLHHSSLANRLKNASRKLELDLEDPSSLFQLSVSLQLYRIAVSGR